jgi:hypothetical protein
MAKSAKKQKHDTDSGVQRAKAQDNTSELILKTRQPKSLVQFFRESPLRGVKLDLRRDRDANRLDLSFPMK